jgi:hypothetical protein
MWMDTIAGTIDLERLIFKFLTPLMQTWFEIGQSPEVLTIKISRRKDVIQA